MNTIRCHVLKRLPYAADGLKVVVLPADEDHDIREDAVPGLVQEGYVTIVGKRSSASAGGGGGGQGGGKGGAYEGGGYGGGGGASKPAGAGGREDPRDERASVEIPDGWRELPWPALRSLASKLTDEGVPDKEAAIAAIEAELKRRAG